MNHLLTELNEEAKILINAFSNSERSLMAFLIHIFTGNFKNTHVFVSELKNLELAKLVKNCQAYL